MQRTAAYVAHEIVLPFIFLKLLLQPALRVFVRLHVPRILAALLLFLALFGSIVGLVTAFQACPHLGSQASGRYSSI
jgi:predicted PurR-regulated permease PerM